MDSSKEQFTIHEVKSITNKGYKIKRKDDSSLGHCIRNPLDLGFKLEIYESQELEDLIYEIKLINPVEKEYLFSVREDGDEFGSLEWKDEGKLSQDTWSIRDQDENLLCTVEQCSVKRALLKRYVMGSLPMNYDIRTEDENIGLLRKKFSMSTSSYLLTFDKSFDIDKRLLISVPLCIENL